MNPDPLLQHFDQLSEAPEAVPRLRRFILDLAVRGKLVEQDPEDEPAGELLRRIDKEKSRLGDVGDIRNQKLQPLEVNQIPFTIPANWAWSQLSQIGIINPRNEVDDSTKSSFVPMSMIFAEYGRANQHQVRPWAEIKKGFTHFAEEDVGLAKITPCFENGKSTVFRNLTGKIGAGTTELHIVRPIVLVATYILIFLKSSHFIGNGIPKMTGTAGQKRVPKNYFAFSPFPLPPLPEQHRIVSKVNELMALCDDLEAAQTKREKRRDRLVAATLQGIGRAGKGRDGSPSRPQLNQPPSPKQQGRDVSPKRPLSPKLARGGAFGEKTLTGAFGEHALPIFFNQLPRLTTRPEHIRQLRQTILNRAVRGKLVPQDPNEGYGLDLLQIIRRNKEQLLLERNIRKEKDIEYSNPGDLPEIPKNWIWAYVDDVAIVQGGKRLPKGATFSKDPTPHVYIRVTDMKNGTISSDNLHYISSVFQKAICRYIIHQEDLYITIAGTIGQVGRVPPFFNGHNLTENAAKLVFRGLDKDFFYLALSSDFVQQQFRDKTKQMAQPKLALKRISGAKFPLPPLPEQHRIVAKVDELMALCNNLEAQITTTSNTRRQLLDATLYNTLNNDEKKGRELGADPNPRKVN